MTHPASYEWPRPTLPPISNQQSAISNQQSTLLKLKLTKALRKAPPPITPVTPDAGQIMAAAAEAYDVPLSYLTGHSRRLAIVRARRLAMTLVRYYHDLSFQAIATMFHCRDHGTAMHACRTLENAPPECIERRTFIRLLKQLPLLA